MQHYLTLALKIAQASGNLSGKEVGQKNLEDS